MGTNEQVEGTETEGYEAPALSDYGTIESWTRGTRQLIQISIVI